MEEEQRDELNVCMTNQVGEKVEMDDEGERMVDDAKQEDVDEHAFELNMVMEEHEVEQVELSESEVFLIWMQLSLMNQTESAQVIQNAMRGSETRRGSSRILHWFPTEEEQGTKDQCHYAYPINLEDNRELSPVVICEQEVEEENRKRRVDINRRCLMDRGASSHYIEEVSKFIAYKWLQKLVKINAEITTIYGIDRGEVDIGMLI